MKKKLLYTMNFVLIFTLLAANFCGFVPHYVKAEKSMNWDLTIMHTNDTHSHLENIAKRSTVIKKIRSDKKNTLLLDAGDVFKGTKYFDQFLGKADVEFMNALGYDVMTLGNHEFDKKPKILSKFIKQAKFPIVNSNFDFSNEDSLKGIANTSVGEGSRGGQIFPAVIININGENVGVFGVTIEETKKISKPGKNIKINDVEKAAENSVSMLEAKGINKIIALTHIGWENDMKLANDVEGIDIIVGGHSHTVPEKYPTIVSTYKAPTVVVHAGKHGKFLGELDVAFDDKGVITTQSGKLHRVADYDDDADITKMLKFYNDRLKD